MKKPKRICVSLWELRRRFPFSRRDQRGMLDEIPQLKNVNDAVKYHQRPKDIFSQEWYLRLHERANWEGAPAQIRLFTWRYMRALRARGLPFYVHTCHRPPDVQLKLQQQGFSNLSSGPHQRSAAIDVVSAIEHWNIPDPLWNYVGTLGETIARDMFLGTEYKNPSKPLKIEWGGRWTRPWDPAHFQLSDWKNRPIVEASEPLLLQPYSDQMRFL